MLSISTEMATPTPATTDSMEALAPSNQTAIPTHGKRTPCPTSQRVGGKHIQLGMAMGLVHPAHNLGTLPEDRLHMDATHTGTDQTHLRGLRSTTAMAH